MLSVLHTHRQTDCCKEPSEAKQHGDGFDRISKTTRIARIWVRLRNIPRRQTKEGATQMTSCPKQLGFPCSVLAVLPSKLGCLGPKGGSPLFTWIVSHDDAWCTWGDRASTRRTGLLKYRCAFGKIKVPGICNLTKPNQGHPFLGRLTKKLCLQHASVVFFLSGPNPHPFRATYPASASFNRHFRELIGPSEVYAWISPGLSTANLYF